MDDGGSGDPLETASQRKKRRRRERKRIEEEEEAARKIKEEAERKRKEEKMEAARKKKELDDAAREAKKLKKKSGTTVHVSDLGDFIERLKLGPASSASATSSAAEEDLKTDWTAFGRQVRAEENAKANDAAKQKGEETDDDLAALFEDLLNNHKDEHDGNGGKKSWYRAQVEAMKYLGSYKLTVDFMDVLRQKKYRKLAIRIGKNDEYSWLYRALARFLIANGIQEDIEDLAMKVSLVFSNKKRLMDLDTFMTSKTLWKSTKNGELPLTKCGRVSFSLVISRALDNHIKGCSYNGLFQKEDILLGDNYCWIYGTLLKGQADSSYKADLTNIWAIMSPFYVVKPKIYPLNFPALFHTLALTGIPLSEVTKAWYRRFLRYHPTLASSEARRYYTLELVRLVKENPWIADLDFFSCTPLGSWQTWGQPLQGPQDWREKIENSILPVLKGVYDYDPDRPDTAGHEEQSIASGQQTTKAHPTASSSSHQQSTSRHTVGSKSKGNRYANTVWGMFDYRRCVIVHGKWHGKGQFVVESNNSTELHVSRHLPDLMPYMLSAMLKRQLFSQPRYAPILEGYISLFDGGTD